MGIYRNCLAHRGLQVLQALQQRATLALQCRLLAGQALPLRLPGLSLLQQHRHTLAGLALLHVLYMWLQSHAVLATLYICK